MKWRSQSLQLITHPRLTSCWKSAVAKRWVVLPIRTEMWSNLGRTSMVWTGSFTNWLPRRTWLSGGDLCTSLETSLVFSLKQLEALRISPLAAGHTWALLLPAQVFNSPPICLLFGGNNKQFGNRSLSFSSHSPNPPLEIVTWSITLWAQADAQWSCISPILPWNKSVSLFLSISIGFSPHSTVGIICSGLNQTTAFCISLCCVHFQIL